MTKNVYIDINLTFCWDKGFSQSFGLQTWAPNFDYFFVFLRTI